MSAYRYRRRSAAGLHRQSASAVRAAATAVRRPPADASAAEAARSERLANALQALARGLPNPWDESTDYFRGFSAALPPATRLTADSFRAALAVGPRYEIDLSPAAPVLTALGGATADWGEDIAGGFRQLASVMRAVLSDLSLAFARGKSVVRVRVWLFGRTEGGTLVGLKSISTET